MVRKGLISRVEEKLFGRVVSVETGYFDGKTVCLKCMLCGKARTLCWLIVTVKKIAGDTKNYDI